MSKLPSITGDFVRLVQAYRRAETAYLQESTRPNLDEVRRLRRLVDSMCARWEERVYLLDQMSSQLGLIDEREEVPVDGAGGADG